MPVSIPTLYAMRFVAKKSLTQRINILQTSYKYQYLMFGSILCINNNILSYIHNFNVMKLIEINFLN